MFATLCEDECALFGRIVSFIDTDEPLHPTRAGYFGKVVGCVVARRAPETTRFFQNNPHVLRLLVRRIENLAVAEVLLRLVGADDPGISPMQGMLMSAIHGADNTGWLAETTLLDQLLDALGEAPETSDADGLFNSADTAQRRANAAEVLVGIARGAPSALADRLATADALRKLFAKGLERVSSNESAAMYGSRLDGSSGANDVDEASTTPPSPRRRTRRAARVASGERRGRRRRRPRTRNAPPVRRRRCRRSWLPKPERHRPSPGARRPRRWRRARARSRGWRRSWTWRGTPPRRRRRGGR